MIGFLVNIEEKTRTNTFFRQVLYTGQHEQVVVMSLQPNEDIGEEIHEIVDQFLRIEEGVGKVIMSGEEHRIKDGDAFVVPAGTKHNVINTSSGKALKLYTIYSPPHHKDKTLHKTKADAIADKENHL
ncbi:cupin [Candidatus Roizmanbacteria bacterium RIFCSPHIGHO2_01_FULL_39_8]|uniref:Cupin n=1 Tax=Candidatus Roizmanbacteria bacterium RIFCSPHIGHO2_01_FULL_39_8 TaxID=1802033 RepID=A0A1F7GMR9_9BACT|nr:MAG: cupin [Candidatus Roizmanbacteria bacterium RIFCSPHIGHO2_01_FULL_39_8]